MTKIVTRRFTSRAGLSLVGDVGGVADGPPVVLLHGGGQTRHSWSGAMRRLVEAGCFVVNYDARGHGDSDWSPEGDYSVAALAADLTDILETISRPAVLVGASMGGMTSFYAIGISPKPIASALVMVDIVLRPAKEGAEKIYKFMTANSGGFGNLAEAADAVAAYNPGRPRPADPSGLMKNLRRRADGRLCWHWDPRLMSADTPSEPPSFADALTQVSAHVNVPTLLVRGGRSDIVDDEGVAEMKRLVPQTEVFDIAEAGHMVAGDSNDDFNRGIMDFLARHVGGCEMLHAPERDARPLI